MNAAEAKAEAERVAKNAAIQETLDAAADAAAAAARDPKEELRDGNVWVRITKAGDGKVHTGGAPRRQPNASGSEVYEGENLAPTFKRGETVQLPLKNAQALEARHFVEIEG